MCVPAHRLQILLDEERHARVQAVARARGVAVAVVIREAIDRGLSVDQGSRQAAVARILAAPLMEAPEVTDVIAGARRAARQARVIVLDTNTYQEP